MIGRREDPTFSSRDARFLAQTKHHAKCDLSIPGCSSAPVPPAPSVLASAHSPRAERLQSYPRKNRLNRRLGNRANPGMMRRVLNRHGPFAQNYFRTLHPLLSPKTIDRRIRRAAGHFEGTRGHRARHQAQETRRLQYKVHGEDEEWGESQGTTLKRLPVVSLHCSPS